MVRQDFGATDPADHSAVIATEPLQARGVRSPRLAALEDSRAGARVVHLAVHFR